MNETDELYLHEVDLGKPMSREAIHRQLREDGDQDVVRAILQLLRTEAMRNSREGARELATGKETEAREMLGAAQGLEFVFWEMVKRTPFVGEVDLSED
jgi:hypothetical protein